MNTIGSSVQKLFHKTKAPMYVHGGTKNGLLGETGITLRAHNFPKC